VERLLILASGKTVTAADVENLLPESAPESERNFLIERLKEYNWNIAEVARSLNMPRSNLYRRIERFGINRESA
jgi:two-component system, NtrC family, nitrogen regulation response regulator NtrX